jgi:hypothetical protein
MLGLKLSEKASFDVSQLAGGFQTQLQSIKRTTLSIRKGTVCLGSNPTYYKKF